jgi:hypothetical protein
MLASLDACAKAWRSAAESLARFSSIAKTHEAVVWASSYAAWLGATVDAYTTWRGTLPKRRALIVTPDAATTRDAQTLQLKAALERHTFEPESLRIVMVDDLSNAAARTALTRWLDELTAALTFRRRC